MQIRKDEGLKGNEKIEEGMAGLQKEPTQENLAAVLTTVRRRMQEKGQFVVAVEPSVTDSFSLQVISTKDGKKWFPAFTSFEEELKGREQVMSTFLADIDQLLNLALQEPGVDGVMLNPWGNMLVLDKLLIRIIKGMA